MAQTPCLLTFPRSPRTRRPDLSPEIRTVADTTTHRAVQYRKLYKDVSSSTYTTYTFSHES